MSMLLFRLFVACNLFKKKKIHFLNVHPRCFLYSTRLSIVIYAISCKELEMKRKNAKKTFINLFTLRYRQNEKRS